MRIRFSVLATRSSDQAYDSISPFVKQTEERRIDGDKIQRQNPQATESLTLLLQHTFILSRSSEMANFLKRKQRPAVVKRDLQFAEHTDKLAFILDNVFTHEECENYIRRTEKMGYEQALVNIGGMWTFLMSDCPSVRLSSVNDKTRLVQGI